MDTLLRFFDSPDLCSLGCLAVGLVWIGLLFAKEAPGVQGWSFWIAGAALVLYVAYGLWRLEAPEPQLVGLVFVRGLVLFLIVGGGLCIVLTVAHPLVDGSAAICRAQRRRRLEARIEVLRQQRDEVEGLRQSLTELRNLRNDAAQRDQAESAQQRHAEEQRRRDDARLECTLFYDQHAGLLQQRFPRQRLEEYFTTYLSDALGADAVEQRARLLKDMLRGHLTDQPHSAGGLGSLAEIADQFRKQRDELRALPYDQETLESLLSSLNKRETGAIETFLKRTR